MLAEPADATAAQKGLLLNRTVRTDVSTFMSRHTRTATIGLATIGALIFGGAGAAHAAPTGPAIPLNTGQEVPAPSVGGRAWQVLLRDRRQRALLHDRGDRSLDACSRRPHPPRGAQRRRTGRRATRGARCDELRDVGLHDRRPSPARHDRGRSDRVLHQRAHRTEPSGRGARPAEMTVGADHAGRLDELTHGRRAVVSIAAVVGATVCEGLSGRGPRRVARCLA